MLKLKVISCLLILALAANYAFAAKSSQHFIDKFRLEAGIQAGYDTNVFNYSRDDVDEFNSYTNPEKFNRVKSVDDFIISPELGIVFTDKLFNHTFRLRLEAQPHSFLRNKVKDYESYRLDARQYLSKDEYLEFRYQHIPDYFLRNLLDRDLGEFRRAAFDARLFSFGYRRPLAKTLDARIRYAYEINDYNENFEEYDMASQAVNFTFWHRPNDYLETQVHLEFERASAKGDIESSARIESDTTYDKYEIGLRENLQLTKKIDIFARYIFSYRKYLTDNSLAQDPFHRDRQDKIHRVGLGLNFKIDKDTQAGLEYEYQVKGVNTASEDPALLNAAILGYEKNIVSFSINYRF